MFGLCNVYRFFSLYPKKEDLFIGIGIGIATYTLSTTLGGFAKECLREDKPYNPFYPLAMILGALAVGVYCSFLVQRTSTKFWVGIGVTIITAGLVLFSGARSIFDALFGGKDIFLSYGLLYGLITLIFGVPIRSINGNSQN
ncbi:hypothetical protein [Dolichospermum circinale]|uniref:hypothetical protein n=1 Tax=Dolichospermum circinale TaxID=109265 RepID=UPI00232C5379|nr:hypothetical protein [Dolichospermum circinale]MDB9467473.1 hypothetical protein [Dolichospermum circinale CS-539/09]MDB9471621.1 hypothetical protein [Dolichospermum circinale CS-539]